jgi:CelD/BcsL family acetyltransferase involved in cellulose biosynthesis
MDIFEITTVTAFEWLCPEWRALWERTPQAGPFQHPDWLLPWWRHMGGGELFVTAIYECGELAAVAPFYLYRDEETGDPQLTLLGNGITDSCDILVDQSRVDVLRNLKEHLWLSAAKGVWNRYDCRDIPGHSSLIPIMQSLFGAAAAEDEPRVVVPLEKWKINENDALPAKIRADLRRRHKRAAEIGEIRLELAEGERVSEAMETLFALHARRWAIRGQQGVLRQANVEDFHREIAERFRQRGWLRLYLLYIADRVGAVNYGFSVKGCTYSYIGGFAPEFASLGLGRIIMHQIIHEAVAEGATKFDFLRGQEDYKLRWGGKVVPQYRLRSGHLSTETGEPKSEREQVFDAASPTRL